jgi:hypothetical protein
MNTEDMGPDDKDAWGLTSLERGSLSMEGKACGMRDCDVPAEQVCQSCKMWYCAHLHFKKHFSVYPEHKLGKRSV